MATPEYLVKLKQKAFDKGWMLEQIPWGIRLREYNGLTVESYGPGFWTLTKYHPLALDVDATEVAAEIRTALANERERARRSRKKSLERGERKSRQLKRA